MLIKKIDNKIFDSWFDVWFDTGLDTRFDSKSCNIRLNDNDDNREYVLNIPGYGKEHINVQYEGNTLYINGKNDTDEFKRSFSVDNNIDKSKTKVTVKHGVLTLKIFKNTENFHKLKIN